MRSNDKATQREHTEFPPAAQFVYAHTFGTCVDAEQELRTLRESARNATIALTL